MRLVRGHKILNEDLLDDLEKRDISASRRIVDEIEPEWSVCVNVEMFFDMRRPEIVKRYKELIDHFDVYLGNYVKVEIEPHQKNQPARTKDLYIYLSDDTNFKSPRNLWRFIKALIDWIPGSNAVLYFWKNVDGERRQATGQINDWLSKYFELNLEPDGECLVDGLTSANDVADKLTGFYYEVFELFHISKERLKKWVLTLICKPSVNEALNYDLLDDMDAIATNSVQKVIGDDEFISPADDERPFLVEVTILKAPSADTRDFVNIREKIQSIVDALHIDVSELMLALKEDFQIVAVGDEDEIYNVDDDPSIHTGCEQNAVIFALNPELMTIKKV